MLRRVVTLLIVSSCLAMGIAPTAFAQGRGPGGPPPAGSPPPGGGPGGPQYPGGGRGTGGPGSEGGSPPPGQGRPGAEGPGRPGFQFGPPGRWWDDSSFARSLKLRPEQQTRMDAIFEQNRGALSLRLQNLRQAESQMEAIATSPEPEESGLFSQIDRVSQARADLEKANTHMLLQIRKEMDPDQIARMANHR